jgi:hypothetical protein
LKERIGVKKTVIEDIEERHPLSEKQTLFLAINSQLVAHGTATNTITSVIELLALPKFLPPSAPTKDHSFNLIETTPGMRLTEERLLIPVLINDSNMVAFRMVSFYLTEICENN